MKIKAFVGWPFLYMSVNDQESLNVDRYQHGPDLWLKSLN
jgi:hypothetical protein